MDPDDAASESTSDLRLHVSRVIKAPIEQVYLAWLDPVLFARFMIPGAGMSVSEVRTDAVEGGRFHLLMCSDGKEIPHGGEYLQLQPFNRIVFSWETPFSMAGSTVAVLLEEIEQGTRIDLTHVRFVNEESRDRHRGGWSEILERLGGALGADQQ